MEDCLKELKEKVAAMNKLTDKKILFIKEPKFTNNRDNIITNIQIGDKDVGWFFINIKMNNWKKIFIEQLNRAYSLYFGG